MIVEYHDITVTIRWYMRDHAPYDREIIEDRAREIIASLLPERRWQEIMEEEIEVEAIPR